MNVEPLVCDQNAANISIERMPENGQAGGLSIDSDEWLTVAANVRTDNVVPTGFGQSQHPTHEGGGDKGRVRRNDEAKVTGRGVKARDDAREGSLIRDAIASSDDGDFYAQRGLLLVRRADDDKL